MKNDRDDDYKSAFKVGREDDDKANDLKKLDDSGEDPWKNDVCRR